MSPRQIEAPYIRVDRAPTIGPSGLLVLLTVRPTRPVGRGPQFALAHALDGAGWWVGLGDDGRVTAGMGTTAGPVSLTAGWSLAPGEEVDLAVHLPGVVGARMEVSVRPAGGAVEDAAVRGALVGASLVPSPGPLLWGCRALRDRTIPEHPFTGTVRGVALIDDGSAVDAQERAARGSGVLFAPDVVAHLDVSRLGVDPPASL